MYLFIIIYSNFLAKAVLDFCGLPGDTVQFIQITAFSQNYLQRRLVQNNSCSLPLFVFFKSALLGFLK